jgi:acyl-CoA oxidase
MPILATTFAIFFTASELDLKAQEMQQVRVQPSQFVHLSSVLIIHSFGNNQNLAKADLSTLSEVHATSAGLKAFCTWYTNSAIEECRQSCGGLGYSSYR